MLDGEGVLELDNETDPLAANESAVFDSPQKN